MSKQYDYDYDLLLVLENGLEIGCSVDGICRRVTWIALMKMIKLSEYVSGIWTLAVRRNL